MGDAAGEASLSAYDELPVHQLAAPVRRVGTDDPRAYERYWFGMHAADGSMLVSLGLGSYPNLATADGFVIVARDGAHRWLRSHRPLDGFRTPLDLHPLRLELLESFGAWRLVLDADELGLSLDLQWRDTKRAVFRTPHEDDAGNRTAGYETFGTVTGRVTIDGHDLELPDGSGGSRDHHWGVRNGVGGRRYLRPLPRTSHCGQWVEFRDWALWGDRVLLRPDDPRPGAFQVVAVERELEFDVETRHFRRGTITNHLADGTRKVISYAQVASQVAFLRRGLYSGPGGLVGSPDDDLYHGEAVGTLVVGGCDDLTSSDVQRRLAGFDQHLCIARCDGETVLGIVECRNPVLYEMCRDGVPGFDLAPSANGANG